MFLNTGNQIHDRVKTHKIFDTCKLAGKWKHVDNSSPFHYEALEDGATIELCMIQVDLIESFRFKKSSKIFIKDSIMEFYEEDLF